MKVISRDDFVKLTGGSDYYGGRWIYIRKIAAILKDIKHMHTGMELGCHLFSVMKKGLTADINSKVNPDIVLNASVTPWEFRDDCFDVLVALQVLEHIPERKEVWAEVKRVARSAVVTLPFNWDCPSDTMHHGITDKTLDEWFGKTECIRKVIPNTVYPPKPRVLLCFDFTKDQIYADQFRSVTKKVFLAEGIK